ncbi:MAG: tetratricopeptide repeat protein [Candidatus Lokiarchaeota archaeon]|nr:tetratricopeptide repeat protein [Candidatus Lokiarchaeota archaeon]
MRTFLEKIEDLKDFIKHAENNFALVTYDTPLMQCAILHHLKNVEQYLKVIDFSRCHERAYLELFNNHKTTFNNITSYLLKNLEKIIPADKNQRNKWANLFNFSREGFNDGKRNTIFLIDKPTDDLLFKQAKDIYSWFIFRLSFDEPADFSEFRRDLSERENVPEMEIGDRYFEKIFSDQNVSFDEITIEINDLINLKRIYEESGKSHKDLSHDIYFPLAELNYKKGNYTDAIEYYEKIEPNGKIYKNSLLKIGDSFRALKNYKKAISFYSAAIKIAPDFPETFNKLGIIYEVDLQDYTQAIENYERAIAIEPEFKWAYLNLGDVYRNRKEFDKALESFQKAIAIDKNYAYAFNALGLVYRDLEDYPKAIENYKKAITIDPKYNWAFANLGYVYHRLKEFDKALDNYHKAAVIDKNYTYAFNGLGLVYADLEDYPNAIENFERAITIDPEYKWAFANLGGVYRQLKEFEKAIENYQNAIAIDKKYAHALNDLGLVYRDLEDYPKAIENFEKAIDIDPKHKWAFANLGGVYRQLKKYGKAIENYQKAIDVDKNYADAYNNLGLAYEELEEYPKAIENYEKAIKIDLEHKWAFRNLGYVYYKLNKLKLSLENFQNAVKIDKEYSGGYFGLGFVYLTLENYQKATESYNKSVKIYSDFLSKDPNNASAVRDLAELYILTDQFNKCETLLIEKEDLLKTNDRDKLLYSYLKSISEISQNKSYDHLTIDKNLDISINWNFEGIDAWLQRKNSPLSETQKKKIFELTELLKKYK